MKKELLDLSKVIENLSSSDANKIFTALRGEKLKKEEIIFLEKNFATKHKRIYSTDTSRNTGINFIYKAELNKLNKIFSDNKLIKDVNGFKILLHGETGTGKTSLVNELSKIWDLNIRKINTEELVNYRMGQTQLNIIKLAHEINIESKGERMLVFMDEIDSLVSKRDASNDVGEHGRVVATFIKFIDLLKENIIFVGATNIINLIDEAILRRFNINIEGKKISVTNFLQILENEGFEYSHRKFSIIKKEYQEKYFTISDLNSFINNFKIESLIFKDLDIHTFFIFKFKELLKIKEEFISDRTKVLLKRIGEQYGKL
ncbi:AAA family ATPase [Mycoplasma todarodis]|uniref:AAA+ ATPase domain-containing protein n=1 Tax=Mycoplasma todarodis TaxID=1937191 RepID=A0A4R0XW99_9MOLU|nr:AAA family ATPase [Mycoplasma todarodis]TCG12097.1 hypothetical protein C4B25_00180 [Mycoplasma todarodis]